METILAIDQSTSATKALLFDAATWQVNARALREHRQIYPQPGWVEHDAEEIWSNTLAVIDEVKAAAPLCLSITNQRETLVVFDRATGRPLHSAIVWQDRRGEERCAKLLNEGHDPVVAVKTGLKIDTYFSASKLAWLMENRPDIAARLRDGAALAGTIDAYLVYRLTGGRVFATDHTNASRTLLYDITRLGWDEDLCRMFSVPRVALPNVRDSTAEFGHTDAGGVLAQPVPIRGVMGDSQASLLAHRCVKPGMVKVTIGSGSSVLMNIGGTFLAPGEGACTTIAWTHAGRATYSFEGIINFSAATVAWLKDQLGLIADASQTESAAAAVPDNGGVYLVPAFSGLSAPHWCAGARAAIVGLSAFSNRHHVIRAALESIAYQIADVLDMMQIASGKRLTTINADGGATRNRLLMQFLADITGRTVSAAEIAECSPMGAALAGALGMGWIESMEELARLPRPATEYRPSMPDATRERLLAGWRRAVHQVLAGVPTSDSPDRPGSH